MTNLNLLAWIDLEMTGLDPDKHHIIEIASLITDADLNIMLNIAMDRIIYVSGDAPDGIKEQINTYKEKLFHVLVIYMTQAVQSDRTNVINLLEKEGHNSLAESIRRM